MRIYFGIPENLDFTPDWTGFRENEIIKIPQWKHAHDLAKRNGGVFILPNGNRLKIGPSISCERLAAMYGGMIRLALQCAMRITQPAAFPLRENYLLFVDEFDGMWGWRRRYKNRRPTK
jgi:hypothetical protein